MPALTADQQIDQLQKTFDMTCDRIQEQTDRMLDLVPKHDKVRRGRILDLHRLKLQKALDDLHKQLVKFS
ncbi:hypothetical protein ACFL10_01275 [Patescibacteria group bacterium]